MELASSSDEEDAAYPSNNFSLADGELQGNNSTVTSGPQRKRHRVDEPSDDPDQATSVRVRHNTHQHPTASAATATPAASAPEAAASGLAAPPAEGAAASAVSPRLVSEAASAAKPERPVLRPVSHITAHATHRVPRAGTSNTAAAAAVQAASNSSAQEGRAVSTAPRQLPAPAASGKVAPAESASSQQGNCIAPDGTFVGRAAAAGLPPSILRQTRAALGLWEQLHETASTPSTVLAPVNRHAAVRTVSVGTDNSAA